MNLQPTLESNLVRIRPLTEIDLEPLYDVAKDPKIWAQHPCKRHLRPEFEHFFNESIESRAALIIIDKATGRIIGSSRFKRFEGFKHVAEIGWTFLNREYWGGKYNKEVKNLMIDYAFNFVDEVLFFVDKNNIRSQKAVEKISGQRIVEDEIKNYPATISDNITFAVKNTNQKVR
ncbi:GNAT family N-acetyltransferase [Spongiimicrobium sp. 3-5]|uniref:GNAT family N-acetyltransferase n=1 Tax=Spongiimicrobium sp. 3-5 TaxID=3332596 RepID=UPI00397F967F